MDDSNLNNYSANIEDRRGERFQPAQYPSRLDVLLSLLRGLVQKVPPQLREVPKYDPNDPRWTMPVDQVKYDDFAAQPAGPPGLLNPPGQPPALHQFPPGLLRAP